MVVIMQPGVRECVVPLLGKHRSQQMHAQMKLVQEQPAAACAPCKQVSGRSSGDI
jgi:hypothetical protein